MLTKKILSIMAQVVFMIGVFIIERDLHPWRVTSLKMLCVMSLFFSLTLVVVNVLDRIIARIVLGRDTETEISKPIWIVYKGLCLIPASLLFELAGYLAALYMGNQPEVIFNLERYAVMSTCIFIITSTYLDSALEIGHKSPFDRELEEMNRDVIKKYGNYLEHGNDDIRDE